MQNKQMTFFRKIGKFLEGLLRKVLPEFFEQWLVVVFPCQMSAACYEAQFADMMQLFLKGANFLDIVWPEYIDNLPFDRYCRKRQLESQKLPTELKESCASIQHVAHCPLCSSEKAS